MVRSAFALLSVMLLRLGLRRFDVLPTTASLHVFCNMICRQPSRFVSIAFLYLVLLLLLIAVSPILHSRLTSYVSSPQRKVLLLAYYRSGSTLTGQLFNHNPTALYWFEPLAAVTYRWGWVYDIIPPRNMYHFDNGTEKPRTRTMEQTLVQPLRAIFSCNLSLVDPAIFVRGFMKEKWTRNLSFSLQSFRSCNLHHRPRTLAKCLVPLAKKCQQSDIIAVKVIRLHMTYVDQLLADDPHLRLIHLVRDPRGLIESWRKVAKRRSKSMAHMRLNAQLICNRVMTDCRIRRHLELKYPGRILLLRYEDLVTATDTALLDVYSGLLQLTLPSDVVDVIKEQMHSSWDNGLMGTLRTNGSATATKWRQTIDSQLKEYITATCRQLLVELNYDL